MEKELKYYRRQAREQDEIIDDVIDNSELELINVKRCPSCKRGIVQTFDFVFATLEKCSECEYEKKTKKKN